MQIRTGNQYIAYNSAFDARRGTSESFQTPGGVFIPPEVKLLRKAVDASGDKGRRKLASKPAKRLRAKAQNGRGGLYRNRLRFRSDFKRLFKPTAAGEEIFFCHVALGEEGRLLSLPPIGVTG